MRLNFEARLSNSPACFCLGFLIGVFAWAFLRISAYFCVLLQAAVLGKPEHIVRNEMENGYTERHFMYQTHLTEPQGIIKKCRRQMLSSQKV